MEQISVKILDRDYKLAVSPDDRDSLRHAASLLDEKMRSVRDGGRIVGVDRIAVMAALQLALELVVERHPPEGSPTGAMLRKVQKMTADIDEELKRQESLF